MCCCLGRCGCSWVDRGRCMGRWVGSCSGGIGLCCCVLEGVEKRLGSCPCSCLLLGVLGLPLRMHPRWLLLLLLLLLALHLLHLLMLLLLLI